MKRLGQLNEVEELPSIGASVFGKISTEPTACLPSVNRILPLLPGLQSSRRVDNPLQQINNTVTPTCTVRSNLLVTSPTKNATPSSIIGANNRNCTNRLHDVPSATDSLVQPARNGVVSSPETSGICGLPSEPNSNNDIASTSLPTKITQCDSVISHSQVSETQLVESGENLTRRSVVGDGIPSTVRDSRHSTIDDSILSEPSCISDDLHQKSLAKDQFGEVVSVSADTTDEAASCNVAQTDTDQCYVSSTTDDIPPRDEENVPLNVPTTDCSIASTLPPVKHCTIVTTSQCALTTAQSFMSGGMGNMWKTLTGDQNTVVDNDQSSSPSIIEPMSPSSPSVIEPLSPSSPSVIGGVPASSVNNGCSIGRSSSTATHHHHHIPVASSVAAVSHCSHRNHIHSSHHHHFLPISSSCNAHHHSFSANTIPHVHRCGDCHLNSTTAAGCTADNAIELGSPELVRDGVNADQAYDTPECITIDDGASDASSSELSSPEVICLDDVTATPATPPTTTSPPLLSIASVCSLSSMKLEVTTPPKIKRLTDNEQAEHSPHAPTTSVTCGNHHPPPPSKATSSASVEMETEKASAPDLRLSAAKVEVLRQRWQSKSALASPVVGLPSASTSPSGSPGLPDADESRETSTATVNNQKAVFEEAVRIARLRYLNVQSSNASQRDATPNTSSISAAPTNDDEIIVISESVEDLRNAAGCEDPITVESPEALGGSVVQTLQPTLNSNDSSKSANSPQSTEVNNMVSSVTCLDSSCQVGLPATAASSPASPVTDGADVTAQLSASRRRKSDSVVELEASSRKRMTSVAGSSPHIFSEGIFDILAAAVAEKSPPSSVHTVVDGGNDSSAETDHDICVPVTVPVAEPPLPESGASPVVTNNNNDKSSCYGLAGAASPDSAATPSPPLLTSAYDDAPIPMPAPDVELADDAVPVDNSPLSPILSIEYAAFSPVKFDDADLDDDLPSFSVSDVPTSKASRGSSKRESGPDTKLTLDDLVAEKRQRLKDDADFEAAMKEPLNVVTHNLSGDNLDIGLKPEHEELLNKLHRTKIEVSDRHPGEKIFNGDRYLSLFSYPETLTLAVCGFIPGSSRTDGRLASLPPDELLIFLEPNFIKLVFRAISCSRAFSSFLFYLLSINRDCFTSFQLHRILYNIVHSSDCDWVPSVLMVARVFVNYGADLSDLCQDLSLITFTSADLPLSGGTVRVDTNDSADSRSSDANFRVGNLKYILQIMTDAIAVGPSRYTAQDCLALTLMVLRVSLDQQLTIGEAHLDVELFIAAAFNAIPSDDWTAWMAELCERAPLLTKQHDNMVYLVGLMPLVSRGIYLRRVLSYLFLREILSSLPSPPAPTCDIDSLFELKISKSLALLHSLPPVGDDYTRARSFLSLVEFSVGADDIPPNEKSDLKKLISVLQRMIGRIPHLATNSGQIKLKEQMVILHTKWDLMLRSLGSDTIFTSDGSQSLPQIEVVGDEMEANDEDGSDAENNASYINGSVAD